MKISRGDLSQIASTRWSFRLHGDRDSSYAFAHLTKAASCELASWRCLEDVAGSMETPRGVFSARIYCMHKCRVIINNELPLSNDSSSLFTKPLLVQSQYGFRRPRVGAV